MFLTLTHFSYFLTANKPPHWLIQNPCIRIFADCVVARYIKMFFYIKVYNGSPSEGIHQALARMVQREPPV